MSIAQVEGSGTAERKPSAHKKAMTVQNMLDMTFGLASDEDAYTPDEPISRMYKSPDPTAFVGGPNLENGLPFGHERRHHFA